MTSESLSSNIPADDHSYRILDLLPGFAFLQQADYTIRYANRTFVELFGDPTGRLCYQVIHGRSQPCEACRSMTALLNRQAGQAEWVAGNGRTYMVYDNLFNTDQGEELVLEIGIDITERKQAELQLKESEQLFRTIADFTYDWEYWADVNGKMIYSSPACQRITGYPPEAFQQDPELRLKIVHPDDCDRLERHFAKEAHDEQVYSFDFRILTADGRERWIGHICQPVYAADGSPLGRRTSNRDVTDRVQAARNLLHSERLATIGRLVASLAHEINNPLQMISTNLELVMDYPLPAEERLTYLKAAREGIDQLKHISAGILDFTRQRQMTLMPTSLPETLRQALALAGEELKKAGIHTRLELESHLPVINAVPEQLRQVFLNLILNAIDQMPHGGEITIRGQAAGGQVLLSFGDTGDGIPADKMDYLFDPFFTTKTGGTGLGLAVSQNIIEHHGGKISAANREEGGAEFIITLPISAYSEE